MASLVVTEGLKWHCFHIYVVEYMVKRETRVDPEPSLIDEPCGGQQLHFAHDDQEVAIVSTSVAS